MKNWSIKFKLMVLSSTLLGLLVVSGAIQQSGSAELIVKLKHINNVETPALRKMGQVDMMHDGMLGTVYRALHAAGGADQAEKADVAETFKSLSDDFKVYLNDLEKLPLKPATKAAIAESVPLIHLYITDSESVIGYALSGQIAKAEEATPKVLATFEALEAKLGALGDLIEKEVGETALEAEDYGAHIQMLSMIFIVCGVLAGALASFVIVRELNGSLAGVIAQLEASSREVLAASNKSAQSATQLSESSTQQASSLQQTMASAEEISAMVNQNAESAIKAKSAVENNQSVTADGTRSVREMLIAIEDIKKTNDEVLAQMEDSNREFGQIVKIISEIGEKTKVINDIVFQTKLLSFNASVEAARAGEHGKGFAVVAEEVGKLAQMSGNAAKEITDMLSGSIKQVNEIVDLTSKRVDQLVEVGKDKISMGQTQAQKCRIALEQIAGNADVVVTMVAEIAGASKEQAQGVLEINKAIGQLDTVTQQNSNVAQQSSSQSSELSSESENLTMIVGQLADIVNGAGMKRSVQRAPSTSSAEQVISFAQHKVKAKGRPLSRQELDLRAKVSKKASGDESVPPANDPGFEQF